MRAGQDSRAIKVLMLGWELPPFFAGGVGVVCDALTRALASRNVDVTYLMPRGPQESRHGRVRVVATSPLEQRIRLQAVASALHSYAAGDGPAHAVAWSQGRRVDRFHPLYGPDLLGEVVEFARRSVELVRSHDVAFDVIHAHDWTTFAAGLALQRAFGKPLVAHVHITEFDKSGGHHADALVYALEREGMHGADVLVAVSERIKRTCVERYGVTASRVRVIYNGIDPDEEEREPIAFDEPVVLFLGRMTLQKGPEYFLEAAARVHRVHPGVRFVMAGSGDLLPRMIERAAELGLGAHVSFTGFVDREQAGVLYRSADVFVMPSVSEPFGIVPLEAMDQAVPTIVSRQSGVAEVLCNALKVDFWDTEDLAAKILAALRYPGLRCELARHGRREVGRMGWSAVAQQVESTYREVTHA
ncbi:MAG TPA: glycosyltransferase family 4 protein [Candidatus Limnocylindrales bacterium]|nr:glycosyltransferase family 4 protein [Candidatus Limnocylindrales bacterium]